MKKRDLVTIRKQSVNELKSKLYTLKVQLSKVQIDLSVAKEKNLKKAKFIRREIAQINTIISEKENKK